MGKGRARTMGAKALLIHPSNQGVCWRHDTEDSCVTQETCRCPGFKPGKRPYKRKRNGKRCTGRSRRMSRYLKRETNNSRDRRRRIESGPGKDVREWIEL